MGRFCLFLMQIWEIILVFANEKSRFKAAFCGGGGGRTLVQTRNHQGFYMLIPLLVFVPGKGADALNLTLSPESHPRVGAPRELSRNCLAPRAQAGIRHLHLRDVSSTHLVGGLSQ